MLEEFLDILFPPVCGICGKIDKNWLCSSCNKRIKKYEKYKYISGKNNIRNFLDSGHDIYLDGLLYCFEYKNIIRKLLLKYKFKDCSYLANFFANMILNNEKINEIFEICDIMIPVPMDKNKKAIRGYNQTELITNIISKKVNFNIDSKDKISVNNCLFKIKQTKTQSTLNSKERFQNIKNAFTIKNVNLENKKVILFDDICTTGATVNEISRILKLAGVKEILVLVIAKD